MVSPFKNFSEYHLLKQLSYLCLSSVQSGPTLEDMIINGVNKKSGMETIRVCLCLYIPQDLEIVVTGGEQGNAFDMNQL